LVIVVPSAAVVLAVLYIAYRFIDPVPPRHFAIAAGMAGCGYDNFARQYARILARNGVELEVRNAAGAVEDLDLLRDGAMGVQEALTALGFTQPGEFMDAIAKPSFLNHAQMDPESLQIDFEWARNLEQPHGRFNFSDSSLIFNESMPLRAPSEFTFEVS